MVISWLGGKARCLDGLHGGEALCLEGRVLGRLSALVADTWRSQKLG